MDDNKEPALRATVYELIAQLQLALNAYRSGAKRPPVFLLSGPAPSIPDELLSGCSVLSSRKKILEKLPKRAIGVEVGTQTGSFARTILDLACPSKLYLIDRDYSVFRHSLIKDEIDNATVVLREGNSWDVLKEFDDDFFDFVYIDAGHSYEAVRNDVDVALMKVKPGGLIICNDFLVWSALEASAYGVYKAVTDVIVRDSCPVRYFAFHPFGYNDIAFERPIKLNTSVPS